MLCLIPQETNVRVAAHNTNASINNGIAPGVSLKYLAPMMDAKGTEMSPDRNNNPGKPSPFLRRTMRRLRGVNTFTGRSESAHRDSIHRTHHFPKCQNKTTPSEAPEDVMPHAAQKEWPAATIAEGVTTNFTTAASCHSTTLITVSSAGSIPPNYVSPNASLRPPCEGMLHATLATALLH